MATQAQQLREHFEAAAGAGSIKMLGMDFGSFARMVAASNMLLGRALELNANTGLGIALGIGYALDECRARGLTS
jgi:hypothetical protein